MTITKRKVKIINTKLKNLLGESLTHLDEEFETFRKETLKVKDYLLHSTQTSEFRLITMPARETSER